MLSKEKYTEINLRFFFFFNIYINVLLDTQLVFKNKFDYLTKRM